MNSREAQFRGRVRNAIVCIVIMAGLAVTAVIHTAKGGDTLPAGRGLYVLDTNAGGMSGYVLLIDTSNGQALRTYNVGSHPDMALSPDGTRLYIASIRDTADSPHSVLETYDTVSGALISSVENPDSFQTTVQIYGSTMSIAPSGRYIYILKLHNTKGLVDEYITAFDTQHNRFLNDHASLNTECNFVMLPTNVDLTLGVACANSSSLRELTLSDATDPLKDTLSAIKTTKSREKWGAVFLQPGQQNVAFVSASGSAFALDRVSAAVRHLGTVAQAGPWLQRGLMSANERVVYFASGQSDREYPNKQDTVVAVDPITLALRGTISTTQPFFSFELSRDGNTLYIINPEQASITIVDTNDFREVRRLGPIGHTPALAIAGP